MSVATEARQTRELIERVDTLREVADSFQEGDQRRVKLLFLVGKDLTTAPGLRPRIAAEILSLSEKTVRAWVQEGVLTRADDSTRRLLLDAVRIYQVLGLLKDLRAAGQTTGLVDEVHRRLVDMTWLDRDDLAESIEQMRRGEGTLRVSGPPPTWLRRR